VTEKQARAYALAELKSLGVDEDQLGNMQSLGLITAVDTNLIPYQTWAFQIERNGQWGSEVAGVDVDVIDGHIVWSHTFME
jgi:hypothetical protein